MAQIIKHRRGSLESLSAVTSSLQKGEIVIASGSSNLTVTNGSSLVFAVPENGQVQATNRFLMGDAAPNTFAAGTYNGMVKGVPYYASGSSTLYLLGSDGNDAINLEGNIQPFSASVATAINSLSASIGGGSIGQSVTALNVFSASAKTSIENLNTFSSSQESKDSTLASYTASIETRMIEIATISGSLIISASTAKSTNDSQDNSISNLNTFTQSFSQSVATSFSASNASITSLSASVASVTGDFSSSVATSFSASAASQTTLSASVATTLSNVSSSQGVQDGRLTSIESMSGSYATTGSNIFYGTQVITGSMYITSDLIVYGSSSLFNITASALDIGANTILLNTATPAVRFGGLSVIDSGSSASTGSLFWDSLNNKWIYQNASGSTYSGGMLMSGPRNTGSLGEEVGLTFGYIPVAQGSDHIMDSIIRQASDKTSISVAGGVDVTGSLNIKSDAATFTIVGNGFSETYLQSNGGMLLQAGGGGVQIKSNNLAVDNNLTVGGDISGSTINGLGNATAFSQSVSASIAAVVANVGSGVGISITNLNSFSSSTLGRLSNIESFSSSVETKLTEIGVVSGSLFTSASTAKSTNDTQDGRLNNLETTSASVNTSVAALNTSSASQQVSIDSLNTFSASVDGRLTEVGVVSGSLITSASVTSISIAALNAYTSSNTSTTALNAFTASAGTKFTEIGVVSGSLIASASAAKITNDSQDISISNLNSKSASVDTSISNLNSFTSSFGTTFSSSVDSRLDTLEGTGTIQGLGTTNEVNFSKVITSGDVVVGGDLVVQGNTVTLNTSQLIVEDKVITLSSGSTNSSTADGAGIEIAGANVNFVYQHSTTAFTSSIAIIAPSVTSSINLGTSAGSSKRITFRNTNGNLDLVPTASIAGDLLQWDGSDFVMSNTIDGGSF